MKLISFQFRLQNVLSNDTKAKTFAITDTKSGFKRTMNGKKYQSKVSIQMPNLYLDYLFDPTFQGVDGFSVSSFENNTTDRTVHTKDYLPIVDIKDYNVMIYGEKFFDQPIKKKFKNI